MTTPANGELDCHSCRQVQQLIEVPLPESLGTSQFMDFTAHGPARLLPIVRPWWRPATLFTPSAARLIFDLRRTLQPFVAKLV